MELKETKIGWSRVEMAQNVALDIPDASYVNLGIGLPELVADHVPEGREVIYHTENGLLGMGPVPEESKKDPELINAGKKNITAIKGACFFHHADSFTMIRGKHIDICVLGPSRFLKMEISLTGQPENQEQSLQLEEQWTWLPE